jgi:hypothetical protein
MRLEPREVTAELKSTSLEVIEKGRLVALPAAVRRRPGLLLSINTDHLLMVIAIVGIIRRIVKPQPGPQHYPDQDEHPA